MCTEVDVVTNQTFSWKDSGNQQENLLMDMAQQTHELLLVTNANVGIS
jgi:hypothetical protein